MARLLRRVALAVAVALTLLACMAATTKTEKRQSIDQPNIVFIMTDDQDYHLGSLDHMPVLQRELVEKGTLFRKHYGHVSICCPARATIWTGKYVSLRGECSIAFEGRQRTRLRLEPLLSLSPQPSPFPSSKLSSHGHELSLTSSQTRSQHKRNQRS